MGSSTDKAAEDAKFAQWLRQGGAGVTAVKGDRDWNAAAALNLLDSKKNGKTGK